MDLATFRELLTPAGRAALAGATALAPAEAAFLACFEKLRKAYPAALAKAAIETVLLRVRARAKFANADRMYFTREALEQSSGDAAARHRASRFAPFGVVADLCAGIGGDALAMASTGLTVHAVEHDPLCAAMLASNAEALGLADRVRVHEADALMVDIPGVKAAFADPARRADGRRHLDPEDYTPPLSAIRGRFPANFPLGVKIAPGVAHTDLAGLDVEAEFVSVTGELKECVLWFGPLRTAARRATLLPSGLTRFADDPPPPPAVAPVGAFVYDPDPAVVRADLAGLLAEEFGVAPIDPVVAIFTGDEAIASPFVSGYRVDLAERVNPARLRQHLRERDVGRVTVVKRGSMIDADELQKKLKLAGKTHRVVLLTRANGEQVMIVGERTPAVTVPSA
jgi:hypothetical protein